MLWFAYLHTRSLIFTNWCPLLNSAIKVLFINNRLRMSKVHSRTKYTYSLQLPFLWITAWTTSDRFVGSQVLMTDFCLNCFDLELLGLDCVVAFGIVYLHSRWCEWSAPFCRWKALGLFWSSILLWKCSQCDKEIDNKKTVKILPNC